ESVASSTRAMRKPASKQQRNGSQQYAQKYRIPRMSLPAKIRFVGDEGQDGGNRAPRDDEAIFLANAARQDNGRQAPGQPPGGPVERPREFEGGPRVADPPERGQS